MGADREGPARGGLLSWLKGKTREDRDLVREMEALIEEGTAEGVLDEGQEEMLLSVLEFRDTLVREVMVPRTEMVSVEVSQPLEELVRRMVEEGHSRVPVFEDEVEHVVGFVTARDVLRHWGAQAPLPPIREVMRPAYFVPETMNLTVLLAEFRRRRIHIAFVVDEYGGISGLATLEDLLEEIVGEIQDESDGEPEVILAQGDEVRVDARTEIEKLEEHLGVELASGGEFETAGGLVFHVLGRIPKAGESFRYRGLEITVEDADARRVKELKIRKMGPSESQVGPGDRDDDL
ncbi:MAG: HlyC/CorC family transporter [Deltaproteobacteria bacterium]|nr:HlyC/CorC family transporter [Deltaproteobacteria bacterium]